MMTLIYEDDEWETIYGEVDRSDPGDISVRLECGCNEIFLPLASLPGVIEYLQKQVKP